MALTGDWWMEEVSRWRCGPWGTHPGYAVHRTIAGTGEIAKLRGEKRKRKARKAKRR